MEMRQAVHPDHAAAMDTEELRENFLVQGLFESNGRWMVYSHNDRLIIGGAVPVAEVALEVDHKIIGADSFLERREMGIINIGGNGTVKADGKSYTIASRDGIYLGRGVKDVVFNSDDENNPAKF